MALLDQIRVRPRNGLTWDYDSTAWYFDIPAIAQLRSEGLGLDDGVTVVVGENGSGKSTLVEAVATAWHDSLTGAQAQHWLPDSGHEDADLHRHLQLTGRRPRPHGGCFLRAETMHTTFSNADAAGVRDYGGRLNTRSHGESFLGYLGGRPVEVGLWVLDEPEAALSFHSCLALLALLRDLADEGSQVLLATHSPLLAACPGATVLELGRHGIRRTRWDELEMVRSWQAFLDAPERFLRHL